MAFCSSMGGRGIGKLCRYDFEKQKEISMQLPDDFLMEGGIVDEIFFYEKTGKGKKYYKAIDIKQ